VTKKSKNPIDLWNRFVKEGLVSDDGDTNVKFPFPKMCKLFGEMYIDYLKAAKALQKEVQEKYPNEAEKYTDEQLCFVNGDVPINFWKKLDTKEGKVRYLLSGIKVADEAGNVSLESCFSMFLLKIS